MSKPQLTPAEIYNSIEAYSALVQELPERLEIVPCQPTTSRLSEEEKEAYIKDYIAAAVELSASKKKSAKKAAMAELERVFARYRDQQAGEENAEITTRNLEELRGLYKECWADLLKVYPAAYVVSDFADLIAAIQNKEEAGQKEAERLLTGCCMWPLEKFASDWHPIMYCEESPLFSIFNGLINLQMWLVSYIKPMARQTNEQTSREGVTPPTKWNLEEAKKTAALQVIRAFLEKKANGFSDEVITDAIVNADFSPLQDEIGRGALSRLSVAIYYLTNKDRRKTREPILGEDWGEAAAATLRDEKGNKLALNKCSARRVRYNEIMDALDTEFSQGRADRK